MALLNVTFVATEMVIENRRWAVPAARARFALARFGRARNRLTGAVLVGAAVGLALGRTS